jgi:hypothetical protein
MRFIVSVYAVVFMACVVGAFYAGYRVGTLEGTNAALQQAMAGGPLQAPQGAAQATAQVDEGQTVRDFFGNEASPESISGEIILGHDLAKRLKQPFEFGKNDALFVIASKPELGPQPLAVIRLNNLVGKTFPIKYSIGPSDLMIQDQGVFSGSLNLKVKLSHSGDAKTNPGDLIGYPAKGGAVTAGTNGVDLELKDIAAANTH